MFQTLRNAWKIEDLRKKLLFTLLILVIVRLGCAIPVPFLDPSRLQEMLDSTQGNLLGYLNLLTGGAFAEATLFALGVSPYITASIVIQLLTVAIPSLERMAKEGPEGQKKIKKITRYSTIGLAILQAYAYYTLLRSSQFNAVKYTTGAAAWISGIAIVLAFSAGAMLVVWLGERIDEKGIGNGISLILFAGIVARIPTLITRLITYIQLGEFYPQYYVWVPLVVILFIAMIAFIVLMNGAERRIPVQYAKRIVGRKQYGGQNTYMPIKVNMSGVRPGFEGGQMPLQRRIPKRGFKNIFATKYASVNVEVLSRFEDGAVVDTKALQDAGIVKKTYDGVKFLGRGEVTKKLTVKAAAFSEGAKSKIEAAGGKAEVV